MPTALIEAATGDEASYLTAEHPQLTACYTRAKYTLVPGLPVKVSAFLTREQQSDHNKRRQKYDEPDHLAAHRLLVCRLEASENPVSLQLITPVG